MEDALLLLGTRSGHLCRAYVALIMCRASMILSMNKSRVYDEVHQPKMVEIMASNRNICFVGVALDSGKATHS
jgi:hypothetical protein